MNDESPSRWLMLLYQFPRGPDSRRVRVWRRLQRIGAVAIKNSVYVLPNNDQSQEDLRWLLTELKSQGAEGAILESRFAGGMSDQEVRGLFNSARTADYRQLCADIETAIAALPDERHRDDVEKRENGRRALARARKRMREIEDIDFFSAPGQDAVEAAMRTLAGRTSVTTTGENDMETNVAPASIETLMGHVWVTRRGVRVDRIASAWLIRRRIDPDARFKFVAGSGYQPAGKEIRFDMFEAEFTHAGDRCTFEVLADLAAPGDAALRKIGEIVHDIDLKDAKFGRPETEGIARLLTGIVSATGNDDERIERGCVLFDDLYRSFPGAGRD